jgi:hypothetical protein
MLVFLVLPLVFLELYLNKKKFKFKLDPVLPKQVELKQNKRLTEERAQSFRENKAAAASDRISSQPNRRASHSQRFFRWLLQAAEAVRTR